MFPWATLIKSSNENDFNYSPLFFNMSKNIEKLSNDNKYRFRRNTVKVSTSIVWMQL